MLSIHTLRVKINFNSKAVCIERGFFFFSPSLFSSSFFLLFSLKCSCLRFYAVLSMSSIERKQQFAVFGFACLLHICSTLQQIHNERGNDSYSNPKEFGISFGKMIQMPVKHYFWRYLSLEMSSPLLCSSSTFFNHPPHPSPPPFPFLLSAKPVTLMSCVQSSQGPLGFHQGLCPSWYSEAVFDVVASLAPCMQARRQTLDGWTRTRFLCLHF